MPFIPKEEEDRIADAIRAGKRPGEICREFKRGRSVVYRIMEAIGFDNSAWGPIDKSKKAREVQVNYNRERRIELSNKLFGKVSELADQTDKPSGLRDLAVSFGILEDKRQIVEPTTHNDDGKSAIIALIEAEKKHETEPPEP